MQYSYIMSTWWACVYLHFLFIILSVSLVCIDCGKVVPSSNAASIKKMEKGFLKWVALIGSLRHSTFKTAKNKIVAAAEIIVDQYPGYGDVTTIQEAVDSVPEYNTERIVIQINPGIYREKVSVPWNKPYITFQGSGALDTVIEWNDTARSPGPDGKPMGTFSSPTVAVYAPYFIARNITFKNFAPYYTVAQSGDEGKQAVALRISGDTAAFFGCRFLGAQDTLYDHKGRHYFRDCYVEGAVDFIFGNGLSMYHGCHLHAISIGAGAVTAQKRTNKTEDTGFSFVNCRVTGSGMIYLGRAWGYFSRVVYAYTYMDKIIVPKGWYNWGDPDREQTVFYGQYKCFGPGANHAQRVVWSHELSYQEAQPFLALSFIDGGEWLQLT